MYVHWEKMLLGDGGGEETVSRWWFRFCLMNVGINDDGLNSPCASSHWPILPSSVPGPSQSITLLTVSSSFFFIPDVESSLFPLSNSLYRDGINSSLLCWLLSLQQGKRINQIYLLFYFLYILFDVFNILSLI